MPFELRYSTDNQEIPLGYFLDKSDGDSEETGLSIANTNIKIWKWGATTLANKNAGGGTHISNGIYYAVFDSTDTNTLGPAKIFVHMAGAVALEVEIAVVSQQYWDAKYGSSGFSGVALHGDYDAAKTAAQASALTTVDTVVDAIKAVTDNLPDSGALSSLATAAALTTVDTVVDAIKAVTDNLPDSGALSSLATAAALAALNNLSVADITGVEVDNDGTPISLSGAFKLLLAILTGESLGGGTSILTFRDIANTKNRISATVDENGNRTAIGTRDAT